MKLAADFRAQARQALRGKWQVLLLDLLLAILLGQALSALDGGEGFLRQLVHIHGRNLLGSGFRMDLKF